VPLQLVHVLGVPEHVTQLEEHESHVLVIVFAKKPIVHELGHLLLIGLVDTK
jgi:hypothetical protein